MPAADATNCLTVEPNTPGPGVIGHILRNRTINSTSYAKTDRWFAYDQVGSLLAKMDGGGNISERLHQDAFGHPVGPSHIANEVDGDAVSLHQIEKR